MSIAAGAEQQSGGAFDRLSTTGLYWCRDRMAGFYPALNDSDGLGSVIGSKLFSYFKLKQLSYHPVNCIFCHRLGFLMTIFSSPNAVTTP